MSILKKTMLAGLAVVTLAGAATSLTTTSAQAGGYGYGHGHGHGHHGYRYKSYRSCFYKYVWRTDYYGYSFKKRIKVCH